MTREDDRAPTPAPAPTPTPNPALVPALVPAERAERTELDRPAPRAPVLDPVSSYLARLAAGSRRTQASALKRVVALLGAPEGSDPRRFPWHKVQYDHARVFLAKLDAEGLALATRNRYVAAFRGVVQEVWSLGLIDAERLARVKSALPTARGERLPKGRMLAQEEIRALFSVCAADKSALGRRDAAALALLRLGLRRHEVVGARLQDLDLREGVLRVVGKGNKEREVEVPEPAAELLRAWLVARAEVLERIQAKMDERAGGATGAEQEQDERARGATGLTRRTGTSAPEARQATVTTNQRAGGRDHQTIPNKDQRGGTATSTGSATTTDQRTGVGATRAPPDVGLKNQRAGGRDDPASVPVFKEQRTGGRDTLNQRAGGRDFSNQRAGGRDFTAQPSPDPGTILVSTTTGRSLTTQAIVEVLTKRAAEAAEVDPDGVGKTMARFSSHDFRRTFISELLDGGADIVVAQKLVGHANVKTTAGYDRRGRAARKSAVEKAIKW